jgi:ASC-1-like (ASCH) protein
MRNNHLVILKTEYIEAILEGRKTIESRFTKTRREFFGRVSPGDKLFLKVSSGPVCATAKVIKVKWYENLTLKQIRQLKGKHNKQILGADDYWQNKSACRYGVLVWLGEVKRIKPVRIEKRDWRAWVVLSEKENFGLVRSV